MLDLLIPLLLLGVSVFALAKKQDVYSALIDGGKDGLKLVFTIAPALVMLLSAVHMLRASGAMELMCQALRPIVQYFGMPAEILPLMLLRPFSGSAALAVGADIMALYGVDSLIGRTAAIVLGSTETTFYTISVYFGAANIKKTRYAVPAALIADFVGFFVGCMAAKFI